jgi:hypothetical protein
LKFPLDELRKVSTFAPPQAEPAVAAVAPLKKLRLRLHRVTCEEETNEIGKDEIHLGGTTVDESGDTGKISSFARGGASARAATHDDGRPDGGHLGPLARDGQAVRHGYGTLKGREALRRI